MILLKIKNLLTTVLNTLLIEEYEHEISMIFCYNFSCESLWSPVGILKINTLNILLQYFLRSRGCNVRDSATHFCELSTHSSIRKWKTDSRRKGYAFFLLPFPLSSNSSIQGTYIFLNVVSTRTPLPLLHLRHTVWEVPQLQIRQNSISKIQPVLSQHQRISLHKSTTGPFQ